MNYQKIYNSLIEKRKSIEILTIDKKDPNYTYVERHHILPKSNGGNDSIDNIVVLKPREHYIAHLLLWKIAKQVYGIHSKQYYHYTHAIKMMRLENDRQKRSFKINNRVYEILKTELRKNPFSEDTRKKLSAQRMGSGNPMFGLYGEKNPGYGSKRTEKQKQNMKNAQKRYFQEHPSKKGKEHHSYGRTPFININTHKIKQVKPEEVEKYENDPEWTKYHQVFTEEAKQKLSKAHKGKIVSKNTRMKIGMSVSKMFSSENGKLIKKKISETMSSKIWVKNIITNKSDRIEKQHLSEDGTHKPSDGWMRGRLVSGMMKDRITLINLDNKKIVRIKKTDADVINNYIENGFIISSARIKYVKMYNDNIEIKKVIPIDKRNLFLSNGWKIGKRNYIFLRKENTFIRILKGNESKYIDLGYKISGIGPGRTVKYTLCYNKILDLHENLNCEFLQEYEKIGWVTAD